MIRFIDLTIRLTRSLSVPLVGGLLLLLAPLPIAAQDDIRDVEVEPITCWWRTSSGAVRIGELFTLTLTCATVETASTRVVVDASRLDPGVVQLPPFEVVGGTRGSDLRTESSRFVQQAYSLRLVVEDAFGRDVPVPPLEVSYRIESRAGENAQSAGRELSYTLPPLPIRILSLVPATALDIREGTPVTLADIDARVLRANLLRGLAAVLVGLAAVALVFGLLRAGRRPAHQRGPKMLSRPGLLRALAGELAGLRQQHQRGAWTSELASRAQAALRAVASAATGRSITQRFAGRAAAVPGELLIARGFPPVRMLVSGSATATALEQPAASNALLDDIRQGLAALTASHYGRSDTVEPADVSQALESGSRLARQLAREQGAIGSARTRVQTGLQRFRFRDR